MKLLYKLPQDIETRIKEDGEQILCATPYDLEIQQPVNGFFVVTKSYFYIFKNKELIRKEKITRYKEYHHVLAVGFGHLEASNDEEETLLISFSMRHVNRYQSIATILNSIVENHVPKIVSDDEENNCPKCGRPYRFGSRVCRHCLNKKVVFKRLYTIIKPYLLPLFLSLFLMWSITGINLVTPTLHRILVNDYLTPKNKNLTAILLIIGGIGLCSLANTVINVIKNRLMIKVSASITYDLRQTVYTKIQSLSISYIENRKTGELMNRITGDTNRVQQFISNEISIGITQLLTLVVVTILLLVLNWKMALFILIPVPFIILYFRFMNQTFRSMYHSQWRISDRANSLLHDILSGIRVVKAFGMEEKEVSRFSKISKTLSDVTANNEKRYNTIFPFLNYLMGIGSFFILYYGGSLILKEKLQLGDLIQFTQYSQLIYGPLGWLTFFPRSFTNALTATERIFEILEEEPKVKNLAPETNLPIEGNVKVDHVTFGYRPYDPVLKDINLEVKPGEMIGLVGHSGAGKSTMINLIMRLYDVDEGKILIDNRDIKEINQKDLRSQMGVVLQETFLFAGTIYQNIVYARPNATLEEVIKAAKIANAHDFIMKLPDAYDTRIGEKGVRLSGGEKQRIAIARAILNNPKILILDEATASVDTETEYIIQEALGRLIKDRTTFAIAHRLSTLRNATKLIVLDKGKVIEYGTHDELLKKQGKYYQLVMAQKELTKTRE